jgi:hypothetical protein
MAKINSDPKASTFTVFLQSFPADREAQVIAAFRDMFPGESVNSVRKILSKHLPELLRENVSNEWKDAIVARFAEAGAQCRVEEVQQHTGPLNTLVEGGAVMSEQLDKDLAMILARSAEQLLLSYFRRLVPENAAFVIHIAEATCAFQESENAS